MAVAGALLLFVATCAQGGDVCTVCVYTGSGTHIPLCGCTATRAKTLAGRASSPLPLVCQKFNPLKRRSMEWWNQHKRQRTLPSILVVEQLKHLGVVVVFGRFEQLSVAPHRETPSPILRTGRYCTVTGRCGQHF